MDNFKELEDMFYNPKAYNLLPFDNVQDNTKIIRLFKPHYYNTNMDKIQYAFGRDYLESWTIKDALREVFQNYIDHGNYTLDVRTTPNANIVNVTICNNYKPNNLEFLRLGNTSKSDGKSIGHHGEGLKAAFLIFARENHYFAVTTGRRRLIGAFDQATIIGETFYIGHTDTDTIADGFITQLHCPKEIYEDFIASIITKDDVLYDQGDYGQLLKDHKGVGNIYSGNLFVCNVSNLNHSYNINPEHLSLDRDRRAPSDWDVDYSTTRILQVYKKTTELTHKPSNYNARYYSYVSSLTDNEVKDIKAVNIDGKVQFYDTHHKEVINNQRVKDILKTHPKFKKTNVATRKDKVLTAKIAAKHKSVNTLINNFKKKHCKGNEDAEIDIEIILYKLKRAK